MTKKKASKKSKPKVKLQLEGLQAPAAADTSTLLVNVFAGSRKPFDAGKKYFLNLIDGKQKMVTRGEFKQSSAKVDGIAFHDDFGDNHVVSVSAKDCASAGRESVMLKKGVTTQVNLMLVSTTAGYNFSDAKFSQLMDQEPYSEILRAGAASADAAERRYTDLIETPTRQASLACLLNLVTAMQQIHMIDGTPANHLRELIWDEDNLKQDRFFAWCNPELEVQVKRSSDSGAGVFTPDAGGGALHPGATSSYRQSNLPGANLQITFHDDDRHPGGKKLVRTEFDIDYFRNPVEHVLFEVFPNSVFGTRTEPRNVYVMRWLLGQTEGLPSFNPPFYLD